MGVNWPVQGHNTQRGFTLTEVLVAMVISAVLTTAVYQTFHFTTGHFLSLY